MSEVIEAGDAGDIEDAATAQEPSAEDVNDTEAQAEPSEEAPVEDTGEETPVNPELEAASQKIKRQQATLKDWSAKLEEQSARIKELEQALSGQKPTDRPRFDDFDSEEDFAKALLEWNENNQKTQPKQPTQQEIEQAERARIQAEMTFRMKEEQYRATNADYDKNAAYVNQLLKNVNPEHPSTKAFTQSMLSAENAPAVINYIGANPQEALAMLDMNPFEISEKILEISQKVSAKPQTKAVKLPTPPNHVGTGAAKQKKDPSSLQGKDFKAWLNS